MSTLVRNVLAVREPWAQRVVDHSNVIVNIFYQSGRRGPHPEIQAKLVVGLFCAAYAAVRSRSYATRIEARLESVAKRLVGARSIQLAIVAASLDEKLVREVHALLESEGTGSARFIIAGCLAFCDVHGIGGNDRVVLTRWVAQAMAGPRWRSP